MDHLKPSAGFKTPPANSSYESTEDDIRLWWLGEPFLSSKPSGEQRPVFSKENKEEIQLAATKIRAGIEAKGSASSSRQGRALTGSSVPTTDVSTTTTAQPAIVSASMPISTVPSAPQASALEFTDEQLAKIMRACIISQGDSSMDDEVRYLSWLE